MLSLHARTLVEAAVAPDAKLADTPPLTLTRNFAWVFAVCVGILLTVPLLVVWTASLLLQ